MVVITNYIFKLQTNNIQRNSNAPRGDRINVIIGFIVEAFNYDILLAEGFFFKSCRFYFLVSSWLAFLRAEKGIYNGEDSGKDYEIETTKSFKKKLS